MAKSEELTETCYEQEIDSVSEKPKNVSENIDVLEINNGSDTTATYVGTRVIMEKNNVIIELPKVIILQSQR